MAGQDSEGGIEVTVRDRNTSVGGDRVARRDAGHDLEGNAFLHACLGLLPTSSEYEGIAALQSDNECILPVVEEERMNVRLNLLGRIRPRLPLPDVDDGTPRRGPVQDCWIDKLIVQDHLCPFDEFLGFEGDKSRIPGSCSNDEHYHG